MISIPEVVEIDGHGISFQNLRKPLFRSQNKLKAAASTMAAAHTRIFSKGIFVPLRFAAFQL